MKLIFAVLCVSRTVGLTRCYKTERFFYIYYIISVIAAVVFILALQHMHYRTQETCSTVCARNYAVLRLFTYGSLALLSLITAFIVR